MKKNEKKKMIIWAAIGAAIGFAIIRFLNLNPVIVTNVSMKPTYPEGKIVFCSKDFTKEDLKRGVVVIMTPATNKKSKQVIKRIVGIPGDTLWIREGILYVNGKESEYQFEKILSSGVIAEPLTLDEDYYFCMGDNRNESIDCRDYGPIHISRIKYTVKN